MALGTDSGDVLVIDIVTAELKWKSSARLPGYDSNILIHMCSLVMSMIVCLPTMSSVTYGSLGAQ